MSMASWTSPRVSGRTLPISRVISLEKSSLRCNSSSAARNMISARFGAGTSRHFLYASLAASTAWSASSSVPETNMPTSSSAFAGLRFSYALPLRDSTHSPLMKFLNIRGATDVAILPPQSPKLAALLFVWSPADLNARHYRAESKFYRCLQGRSNLPADGLYSWEERQSRAAMTMIAHKLGRVTIGILLFLIVLLSVQRSFGNSQGSITVDGRERTFEVHVPPGYKGEQAGPLVVALHGRGGTGHRIVGLTHFDDVADAHGFLVAYPDGLNASWADGRGATPSDTDGIDDIKFLSELIRKLIRDYKIDSWRVFVTGISNGGFMSQRVACELSSQVAAVGVVAAT